MAEGNGHSDKIPRSITISPVQEIPSHEQMLQEIWVDMKMLKMKVYGDKEKSIVGVADELKSMRVDVSELNEKMTPLLDDRKVRMAIVKIIVGIFSMLGIGKIIHDYLLK